MEICRLCGGEVGRPGGTCKVCRAPAPPPSTKRITGIHWTLRKSALYRIACIVAVPLLAYLAGAMFAQGLIDQFTRAGIGG